MTWRGGISHSCPSSCAFRMTNRRDATKMHAPQSGGLTAHIQPLRMMPSEHLARQATHQVPHLLSFLHNGPKDTRVPAANGRSGALVQAKPQGFVGRWVEKLTLTPDEGQLLVGSPKIACFWNLLRLQFIVEASRERGVQLSYR